MISKQQVNGNKLTWEIWLFLLLVITEEEKAIVSIGWLIRFNIDYK